MSIIARVRDAHPDHRAVARGMLVGTLFVLVGKMAGAAKEMAVAWRYGVSEIVDAYLFVFNLVNWPVAVWFSVLCVVLVPLAATIRAQAPQDLRRFRAELFGLTLLLACSLLFLAEFGFPVFLRSSNSGLAGSTLTYALAIAPALSWITFFGVLISLWSVWVMVGGRHSNTLLEGIPAFVILLVLLATSGEGPAPLVWGTLAGLAVHVVCLCLSLAQRNELEGPRFSLQSQQWRAFWRGFGIMLVGQALFSLSAIVDQLFAARLAAGSIATLGYANRIVALVMGLGATAVSRATLPVFADALARGSGHVRRMAMRWAQVLFGLGVVTVALGWLLAPWGVRVLFERGAFTAQDSRAVTEVLSYALFQVPFFFSGLVFVSFASSAHNYAILSALALTGLIVKVVGNAVLVPWIALNGLVLTNTLVYGLNAILLAALMKSGRLRGLSA